MAAIRKKLKLWIVELLAPSLFVTYLFAAIAFPVAFALYYCGCSSWIRPFNLAILLILLVLHTLAFAGWHLQMIVRRKLSAESETNSLNEHEGRTLVLGTCILVLAVMSSVFAGREWRAANARTLCSRCEPVLSDLDEFKQAHGIYPQDLNLLPSFGALTNEFKVYLGKRNEDGEIEWNVDMVGHRKISLFVNDASYQCVVPIEKTSLITFSSFAVYSFTSVDPRWTRTRLHWSLGGAYID